MSTDEAVINTESKTRHSLSSIDKDALTAICAVCGQTDIYKQTSVKRYTSYTCATKSRQRSAAYRLAHPHVPHPQQFSPIAHVLSNVDDTNRTATCLICGPVKIYIRRSKNLITRVCKNASNKRSERAEKKRKAENRKFAENYKLTQGCKNCGAREESKTLEFHAPGRDRRSDHIGKLMRLKRERLAQELKKFDVLCKDCHDKVHPKGLDRSTRRFKRNPLPFMHDA